MKVAALDLGTNTFLCLIAEGNENGITKVYKDLVETVRLGQGVDKTGELHPEALVRARNCLQNFKKEIDAAKVDRVLAMATSAARDAKNGHELFKIGADLGIPIEVIPGEDEARITYQGAMGGSIKPTETTMVIDVGGGSTELIIGKGSQIIFGESLNIGAVRLTEKFITAQPVSEQEQKALNKFIDEQIAKELSNFTLTNPNGKHILNRIVAVAGTPTSIAAIEVGGFSEEKVNNFFLSKERLREWVQIFAQTSVEEKRTKYQLAGRADIIFAGASILLKIIEAVHMDGLYVSTKGVRYGVALEMLRSRSAT